MTDQRHQLSALAHLAALYEAVTWLDDARTAAILPGQQRRAAHQSPRAIARRGTLYAAELAERRVDSRITPSGAHPMPVSPAVVEAQATAHRTLTDCAWIASSNLYRHPLLVFGPAWTCNTADTSWTHRVTTATRPNAWWSPRPSHAGRRLDALWPTLSPWLAAYTHLRMAIPHLACSCPPRPDNSHRLDCGDACAAELAGRLQAADTQVRAVAGCGPAWVPLPGVACPVCLLAPRHMEAEVSSTDAREWTIRCRDGNLIMTAEGFGREHSRLGDLLALIRSVRRQHDKHAKRGRIAS